MIWFKQKRKSSEVFPYTQNRKLGNLRNMSLLSNADNSYNLRFKNGENMNWAKNWKVPIQIKRKKKNFRDFRVFDFDLYPRSKTRKSTKFCLLRILTLVVTQDLKTPEKWCETKTKRFIRDLEQKQKFSRFPSFQFRLIPKIENSRSSHQRTSMFLEILQNSQENTCARVSFLIKLQAVPATLLKKRFWHGCFPVNFAKFLRTHFLQNTSGRLLLEYVRLHLHIQINNYNRYLKFFMLFLNWHMDILICWILCNYITCFKLEVPWSALS